MWVLEEFLWDGHENVPLDVQIMTYYQNSRLSTSVPKFHVRADFWSNTCIVVVDKESQAEEKLES
jgi:hypothetical protein